MAKKISGSVGKGGKNKPVMGAGPSFASAVSELTRQGMSFTGANQVLNGVPVTSPGDRALLAKFATVVGQPDFAASAGFRQKLKALDGE